MQILLNCGGPRFRCQRYVCRRGEVDVVDECQVEAFNLCLIWRVEVLMIYM